MSTDLPRRLKEGADNIHSIGEGRAADLLREAADAFETARHDFGSTMRCDIAPMIGPGRVDGRLADEPAGQLEYCAAHKWQDAGWHAEGLLGRREDDTNEDLTVTSLRPYFVGPHLYIAEDEAEARALHSDMVATSSLKLNDLRDVIASNVDVEDGDRWDASLRIDALIRMLQDSGEMPILDDLDAEIVEFCEGTGWVKVSKRDAAEWCRRGKGNVGVLQSYYESKVRPHLDALTMLAVKEVRP